MAGKQAKILSDDHVEALRDYAWRSRYTLRNDAMVLLSVKAGLRAAEIAHLTWPIVLTANGKSATRSNCAIRPPKAAAAAGFQCIAI